MNNDHLPSVVFVKSLFASKTFWMHLFAAVATLAGLAGYHWGTAAEQAAAVDYVMGLGAVVVPIAGILVRLFGTSGPVSLTAPASPPAPQQLEVGTQTVTVVPPAAPIPPPPPITTGQAIIRRAPPPLGSAADPVAQLRADVQSNQQPPPRAV